MGVAGRDGPVLDVARRCSQHRELRRAQGRRGYAFWLPSSEHAGAPTHASGPSRTRPAPPTLRCNAATAMLPSDGAAVRCLPYWTSLLVCVAQGCLWARCTAIGSIAVPSEHAPPKETTLNPSSLQRLMLRLDTKPFAKAILLLAAGAPPCDISGNCPLALFSQRARATIRQTIG